MTHRATGAGILILLAALLGSPLPLRAQVSSEHGILVLELPASTAAQAMGNAPRLSRGPSSALFYNPGLLPRARGLAGSLQRYGARATLLDLTGATEWWHGGVGLGLRALTYEAPATGRPAEREADLYTRGPEGVSELAATVGYGRRVGALALGATGTLLEQRVGGERDAGLAVALGAVVGAGPLDLGIAVRNLGPKLELGGRSLDLPHRTELNASSRSLEVGPLDLTASGSVVRLADGEVIPALGVEVGYWPVVGRTFLVRGGIRRVPDGPADELSFGAAFQGDAIVLEYAYRGFDGHDGAHRLGIGWR